IQHARLDAALDQQRRRALATRLAAMMHIAVGDHETVARDAGKLTLDLAERDIDRAVHMPIGVLGCAAHINHEWGRLTGCEGAQLVRADKRDDWRLLLELWVVEERLEGGTGAQPVEVGVVTRPLDEGRPEPQRLW